MIITTLFISGLILVATTVAGFLVSTQIRQATDTEMSARAIFAADAGIEASLYCYRWDFQPGLDEGTTEDPGGLDARCGRSESFPDGMGGYSISLLLDGTLDNPTGFTVTSEGAAAEGRIRRVLRTGFLIES